MATHSGVLAWRIPGTEEPGRLAVYGVAQSWTRLKQLSSSSSLIKDVYSKLTANVIPDGERLNTLPPRLRIMQGCLL